ncbi:MAG TPA: OmpA family protein [Chitinophagaceae bacterium]|nr:OmpA family protein [Chitinophagaceae bacterium]
MKTIKILLSSFFLVAIISAGCSTWNKSQKGAVIGAAGGAAAGAVIGKVAGNTALGAIIGATVGGVTGAVIGRQMDKQAEEMKKDIPDATVERVGEGIVIEFNNKILFGFNKSNLSGEAENNLAKLIPILQKYPDTNIEVQGHTDSRGTIRYNQALSERRASTVTAYLSGNGTAFSRFTTIGFGETLPKYQNNSEEGQLQNRRVEFLISANAKMKADAASEAGKSGSK